VDIADSLRESYKWQKGSMKFESWANTLQRAERVQALHRFGRNSRKKIKVNAVRWSKGRSLQ
jgi:hypothetical protein